VVRIEHWASSRGPKEEVKIYAIVRTGGKQYRVEPEQLIDVDSLPAEVGSTVEMTDVLLIAGNGDVKVGRPVLEGARVIAEVVEQGRGPKIIVFKYKAKTRYRRRRGHRQGYTRLVVRQILTAEGPPEAEEKPKRRRPSKAEAEPKPARRTRARKPKAEAAPVEAEEKPARRTRTRKPKAEAAPVEAEAKPAPRTRKPTAKSETKKPKRTRTKTESG
jgi:large subunit ribosomal protein L21